LIVERTDFISVPVTDMERSKRFYAETLGLAGTDDAGFPEYQLGENVSLYLVKMESVGSEFSGPHSGYVALRVPDVEQTRAELEAKGIEFFGETRETPVCKMAFFRDPDGNSFMLHRRHDATPA
jgi:catechol 2,3-dioxygenase-like lactoylglutathione lyase family enzyme